MSSLSEQDHLNAHGTQGPLSYAPRWLREKPDAQMNPSQEAQPDAGRTGGRLVPLTGFDTQLEKAVSEALRHPLDPELVQEPAGLTGELRRMAVIGVAGRFAAAVGVSALVALFFVVMIPASRQPEGLSSSASGIIQSIKAALPQQVAAPQEDAAKPTATASEFQAILASTPTNNQPVTREQSEKLLQQFVQWRQKPATNQAP